MERRQAVRAIVLAALLMSQGVSRAQLRPNVIVIGLLDAGDRPEWWNAFRKGMRELGYVEGRDVRFEARLAKGDLDTLTTMAKGLVRSNVDVIVTGGAVAAVAAQRASTTIPIIMASGTDQVSLGLAATLAHPGGNVTGVSSLNSELMNKRFELLREVVPKLSRLGVLWHGDNTPSMASVRDIEGAAANARIGLQSFGVRTADQLGTTFAAMSAAHLDALVVVNSPFIFAERKRIADLALAHRLAGMYGAAEYVDAGGLLSYAPSYAEMFRHAAIYVDKILKGARPADMPIEQPTTFELVINAATARSLGLVIPAAMMARANRVVQ